MTADTKYAVVSVEEELPVAVSAAVAAGNAAVAQDYGDELTWTDGYFCDRDDVVAVFDYDHEQIHRHYVSEYFISITVVLIFISFIWTTASIADDEDEEDGEDGENDEDGFSYYAFGCLLVSIALLILWCYGACSCLFNRLVARWPVPHTAITRTGLRHVQPAASGNGYSTIHIPFADIEQVTLLPLTGRHSITTVVIKVSSNNGEEYVVSGFPQFQIVWGAGTFVKMYGMYEPVRFKQLLMHMKDSNAAHSTNTIRSAELVRRVEAALDGGIIDEHSSREMLREVRDELRRHDELFDPEQATRHYATT